MTITCLECGGSGIKTSVEGATVRAVVCQCADRSGACVHCGGSGSVYTKRDGCDVVVLCPDRCTPNYRVAQKITGAGLPAHHYRVADWGFYVGKDGDTARKARAWLRNARNGGVWLASEPGSGKTCLSVLLAKEAVLLGVDTVWVDVPSLLDSARKGMRDNRDCIAPVCKAGFLVLDDIDKVRLDRGKHTEWSDEQLWRIIKTRCEADKPTVVTSNISVPDWCERTRNTAAVRSRIDGHFFKATLRRGDARGVRGAL